MKGKWGWCITFHALVLAIFLTLNYLYTHSLFYRSLEGVIQYDSIQSDLQIVNFGASHAANGIDYSVCPEYRSFNFAFGSQSLYFDSLVFDKYKEHFGQDCVVIFDIFYASLYSDPKFRFQETLPRYSRVLDIDKIPDVTFEDLLIFRYFPVLGAQKRLIRIFVKNERVEQKNPALFLNDSEAAAFSGDGWLYETGAERAREHLTEITDVVPEEADAFLHMLELCKENHWKAVVVSTPLTIYYHSAFSTELLDMFHNDLSELLSNYPGVPYLDYTTDERFYDQLQYFTDVDHLNYEGRIMFTAILVDDLKQMGLLP